MAAHPRLGPASLVISDLFQKGLVHCNVKFMVNCDDLEDYVHAYLQDY